MNYKYDKSFIGGSFDHLHIGHHKLIHKAFKDSYFVTIGLTSDEMIANKKFAKSLENYDLRYRTLFNYLNQYEYSHRFKIIKLTDIYGTTLRDKDSQAIFVTEQTKFNAQLINKQRNKLGMQELLIVEVEFVRGDDDKVVSSERIRSGEINTRGESYIEFYKKFNVDLFLPDNLRHELINPFGEIVKDFATFKQSIEKVDFLVTVGDIVSADFIKNNFQASISVIDLKTRRQNIYKSYFEKYFTILPKIKLSNPAGVIKFSTALSIQRYIQNFLNNKIKKIIVINGEEDLLALPFILFSPLESIIIYGIHDKGMAIVEVNVDTKEKVKQLLARFYR